jgi:hypothetical protein
MFIRLKEYALPAICLNPVMETRRMIMVAGCALTAMALMHLAVILSF